MSKSPTPKLTATPTAPLGPLVRVADLPARRESRIEVVPKPEDLALLAAELGLLGLRKLRFAGWLAPVGRSDWALEARLEVTVIQPCVVSLAPVTTRVSAPVARRYLAGQAGPSETAAQPDRDAPTSESDPEAGTRMPEDDTREPLGDSIDLSAVLVESLALTLPDYPRAEGAELAAAVFTAPGAEPMSDEAAKPFAGLVGLRNKLGENGGD